METRSDIINGNVFLEEIHLLRQQKGNYLCRSFSDQLEDLSYEITKATWKYFGFKRIVSNYCQKSTKISDKAIDLCLDCIEKDLQKTQSSNCFTKTSSVFTDSQVLQILMDISDDLRSLSAYIKYTISFDNPDKSKSVAYEVKNNSAENSLLQF